MSRSLADIVRARLDDEGFRLRMAQLYADVDRAVAAKSPACLNRGACCRFEEFGHRLYVSTAELTCFVAGQRDQWRPPHDSGACPYQREGVCTAREHRPLGCRVFFCDPDTTGWQGPIYEEFLAELRRIGDEYGLDYRYVEWLSALTELGPIADVRGIAAGRGELQPTLAAAIPDVRVAVDPDAGRLIQLRVVEGGRQQPTSHDPTPRPS